MPEILPSSAPYPKAVLGWDGTAYRVLAVDDEGHLANVPYPDRIWSRPGITQVLEDREAQNATWVVYTVPGGVTFYLTSIFLNMVASAAGAVGAYADLQNAVPVTIMVWRFSSPGPGARSAGINFVPPLEVPTGHRFQVSSGGVGVWVSLAITGYTI